MKKLLVIRLGALGDLVHASASLDGVKRQAAQGSICEREIHLLTGPAYPDLLQMMPSVDRAWILDKRKGWPGLFELARQLRQIGIEEVINLHPSFKSWLLTQLIRPKRQAVYHKEKLKAKGLEQRRIPRRHAVADFFQPFQRLFRLPAAAQLVPKLQFNAADRIDSSAFLERPLNERWIGLIPGVGAKRSNRAWLSESYCELIQQLLAQPNVRIFLIGGPDEQALSEQLIQQVADQSDRLENHCGRHDIPGTARLLAQCDVVVGGDTGPLHLATAVGTPMVAIFGPTSLTRTGPAGDQFIQALTPPDDLTCWPCELATCPLSGDAELACMKQIPVTSVLQSCLQLLG